MMLGCKSRGGLYYSERIRSEQSVRRANLGVEGWKRIEIASPSEAVEGRTCSVDLVRVQGRPCFVGRNGQMHYKGNRGKGSYTQGKIIGVTMGKSYFQLGFATTNKDCTYKGTT